MTINLLNAFSSDAESHVKYEIRVGLYRIYSFAVL